MKLVRLVLLLAISLSIVIACGPATTIPASSSSNTKLINGTVEEIKVVQGLKEVLRIGVNTAKKELSTPDDYLDSRYKIRLSDEIKAITEKIKGINGYENVEEELINKFNTSAALTVKDATKVFKKAINDLEFKDAEKILKGKNNAATTHLEQEKIQVLHQRIQPLIQKSLDQSKTTAAWEKVLNTYIKVPFSEPVSINLSDYLTKEVVKSTLAITAQEETTIRTDKTTRSSALLQKVFELQDHNKSTAGRP